MNIRGVIVRSCSIKKEMSISSPYKCIHTFGACDLYDNNGLYEQYI